MTDRTKFLLICLLIIILWLAAGFVPIEAQMRKAWVYKGCYTRSCVTEYLNSLPADVQVTMTYDTEAVSNAYDIWVQK